MSGLWTGRYYYDDDHKPVSFTVWLDEMNTQIVGTTLEPNTFAPDAPDELAAVIVGERDQTTFNVQKIYTTDLGFESEALKYTGTVSSDFTSASGRWTLQRIGSSTGTFQLTRLSNERFMGRTLLTETDATLDR